MRRMYVGPATAVAVAALVWIPSLAWGQTLGAARNFAIVGGQQVTAAGPASIAGDVGVSTGTSITGFPPASVVPPFVLHVPNDGASILAQSAVTALFTSLSTAGGPATTVPDQLAGQHLGPGVYSLGAANLASGGLLTLSGNGTYIFRVASSLTAISTSNVLLLGGAQACNIWWQVGSSATLGGTTFSGNVVGLTGINSLGPNAILEGRLLTTIPGSVTMAGNNTVNAAFCAIVPPPGGPVGLAKTFGPAANGPGGISTLTITLTNANASAATLINAVVDALPPGVVVAASPNASTTCAGGSVTAPAGGSSITLSPGAIIPGGTPGSCTIIANVTAATPGIYTNSIAVNILQTSNGFNAVPAIATLTIVAGLPAVPTLSEWAMIVLAALLCLSGFFAIRRRRVTD